MWLPIYRVWLAKGFFSWPLFNLAPFHSTDSVIYLTIFTLFYDLYHVNQYDSSGAVKLEKLLRLIPKTELMHVCNSVVSVPSLSVDPLPTTSLLSYLVSFISR